MIRPATPDDVADIHALVCELADFERLRHAVVSTPDDFQRALFGEQPILEALVAAASAATDHPASPPPLAGVALFYPTFSTFTGRPGLWLEDLYVRPAHRGRGLGQAFLQHLFALAHDRRCARVEWSVLDWNEGAIRFYESLGAEVLPDWRIARYQPAGDPAPGSACTQDRDL